MQSSQIPTKFPVIWGSSAASANIRTVPETTTDTTAASLALGWPPATFSPLASGGSPPDGRDDNGILNQITAWEQWEQAGGPVTYDSAFQAAIGGYPKGAIVASATTFGVWWLCTADNNTTNPDSGGAGWVTAFSGRHLSSQTFSSSATITPPAGWFGTARCRLAGAGGGAGAGFAQATAGYASSGAGGGAGGFIECLISAALFGASQIFTVGAGGSGSIGGYGPGGTGGTTTLGSLILASGAGGGISGFTNGSAVYSGGAGGAKPTVAAGVQVIYATQGDAGQDSLILNASSGIFGYSGNGGSSLLGAGATGIGVNAAGLNGAQGSGGSGGFTDTNTTYAGGSGGGALLIIDWLS